MKVVICGGGVIGCSTAYYLAKKGIRSIVVERCGIACAASGKAGEYRQFYVMQLHVLQIPYVPWNPEITLDL